MQSNQLCLVLALSCVSAAALANAPAATTSRPLTNEEWLRQMTDFTRNGQAFRDPRLFVQWSNAITEPGFYATMAQGITDPAGWLNMMNSAASPDAFRNWAQTADPQVAMRWAAAMADPNLYTAMTTQMMDPGKMMRWVMMPLDPKWLSLGTQFFNPNFYMKWGASGIDPRTWNLMGTVMNPALYTSVAGAAMNPKSYGPMWGVIPSPVGDTTRPLPWSSNYGVNSAPFNGWLNWKPMPAYGMTDPWMEGGNSVSFIPSLNTLGGFLGGLLPTGIAVVAPAPAAAPKVAQPAATVAKQAPAAAPVAAATPAPQVSVAPPPVKAEVAKVEVKAEPKAEVKTEAKTQPRVEPKVEAKQPEPAPQKVEQVAKPAAEHKVVLAGDDLFKSGKITLTDASDAGKQRLAALVEQIKATPGVEQIVIIGHADPTGNNKLNRKLSAARAKAVQEHLVAAGIKPAVIVSSGLGDKQPVVRCDSNLPKAEKIACNAPNRRVEVELRMAKPK